MERNTLETNDKKVSISRVVMFFVLGLLLGVLVAVVLDRSFLFYILPFAFGIGFGVLGYLWKISDNTPQSLEKLTTREWIVWVIVSIIITPIVTGTIAYYMYKYQNKYPRKWRGANTALLVALLAESILFLMFS